GINEQQAQKELKMGDFYRRTKKPCSAWFYYDLVCRRYPQTQAAKEAQVKLAELRDKAVREGKPVPTPGSRPQQVKQEPSKAEVAPPPRTRPDDLAPPPPPVPPVPTMK